MAPDRPATLRIRNWAKWQSYRRDRGQPPWIKVHRLLMRDMEWIGLSDAERGQLMAIWLLAADHDGEIPDDASVIRKVCFMEHAPDLDTFIRKGFIEPRRHGDATVTPTRRQRDAPEKRREETETETEAFAKANEAEPRTYAHVKADGDAQDPTPEQRKALRLAIHEHLHLGRTPEQQRGGRSWTERDDMSIAVPLARQHGAEAVAGAIAVCRKVGRFKRDDQLTMRVFNGRGKRDLLNRCIDEWRRARIRNGAGATRLGELVAGHE